MGEHTKVKDLLYEIERLKQENAELKTSKPYGLVWEEKPEQFEADTQNAVPVLTPKGGKFKDLTLDPDIDHNILIEGDNYHALSVLSYTHKSKIDLIYIDPPYNTGNKDFRYNDNFVEKDDQYRHSKWLSFMAKRLRLAAQLLSENGAIFISIDHNESAQLRLLCDQIFGEANFIADFIWNHRKSSQNDTDVTVAHNYTLAYAKNRAAYSLQSLDVVPEKFANPDNDARGPWIADPMDAPNLRPNLTYPIRNPNTGISYMPPVGRCWRFTQQKYLAAVADGRIVFGKNGRAKPQHKRYLSEAQLRGTNPNTLWVHTATATDATKELMQIFSGERVFDTPKPTALIAYIITIATQSSATILDFFAGSGTTGHAVLQLNKQGNGNRRFILCSNNENKICEDVTYERVKRVMQGYTTPTNEKVEGLGGNLAYLKTDFVEKELTIGLSDEAKRTLARRANLILSLRQNTFTPVAATESYEITTSPTHLTGVYFTEDKRQLNTMLDTLKRLAVGKAVTVFVFSWSKGAYKKGVAGYTDCGFTFEDIPEPLVEVYQSIGL